MSEKLIELEIKIMHLEQANQELSDEHYKQQQQIERLEKQVKILNDQFKQLQHTDAPEIIDEPPPHY